MSRPPMSTTARDDILGMEKKPPTVHTCLESQKECMWSRSTGWKECQLELLDQPPKNTGEKNDAKTEMRPITAWSWLAVKNTYVQSRAYG